MYAHRSQWQRGERYAFEAEAKTDQNGRFRFSSLPVDTLQLNDRDGLRWELDKRENIVPDQNASIEIRATLPDWSQLKPVAQP